MSDVNLYLRFVREDVKPKAGNLMLFAVVSFGGATLTNVQKQEFTEKFMALPSCANVDFCGSDQDYRAIIDSVRHGDKAESDFFSEIEACARQHYKVKRVTQPEQ